MKRYGAFILIVCIIFVSIPAIPLFATTPTGLVDGTDYYVMNSTTEKYLSPVSSTNSNNVRIVGRDRGTQIYSRWTVNIIESTETNNQTNYIRLTNANGNAGRNLYVSETNLVIYNIIDEQSSFDIRRIETKPHQGQYVICYGNQYVAMDSSRNVYLTTSTSDNIYWTFMAVEKGYADFVNFDYHYSDGTHYDSTVNDTDFSTAFSQYGFGTGGDATSYATVSDAYEWLRSGDIFIYHGHGEPARLVFETDNRVITGLLRADTRVPRYDTTYQYVTLNISEYDPNALALQRCVIYMGCSTGVNFVRTINNTEYVSNLLDSTFEKGAHFVLGTTEVIYLAQGNEWLKKFFRGISMEKNIKGALDYADDNFEPIYFEHDEGGEPLIVYELPYTYVGDANQYLQ